MAASPQQSNTFVPPPVTKIEDTGLSVLWLQDLALKILYFGGYLNGFQVSERIALPFAGIIEHILENLKREKFVDKKPDRDTVISQDDIINLRILMETETDFDTFLSKI